MTFEEWWDEVGHNMWCDNDDIFLSDLVKAAWDAAYEQGAEDSLSVSYMAGLKDASSRKLPEGYVLVPVEPTEAMEKAFLDIYERRGWFMRSYKNMIQAAQEEG